jgi:hypothetical protein
LSKNNIETTGDVKSAFYNAPFVPPFMRRNEVMIEVTGLPFSKPEDMDQDLVMAQ